jgi:sulfonate transport system substrate-binding protein
MVDKASRSAAGGPAWDRRRVLLALGVGVGAVGATVALSRARRRGTPNESIAVRIAFVGMGQTKPFGTAGLVASDGWLERELRKQSARLEWIAMPNANVGPMTNEAFANGSIDLAGYGELPSIIANAAGIHTKTDCSRGPR